MKKILTYILGVSIIIFAFSLLRDIAAQAVVTALASQATGAPVRIGRLSMSLMRQTIEIRDLCIYNPVGFPKGILAALPEIQIRYDLFSLLGGRLHLPLVDIELSELGLIRSKEGRLNVDALRAAKEEYKDKGALPMRLDIVNLYIGRLVSKDYSLGIPIVKVYEIRINKSYRDITSVRQLVLLILSEPMKAAGIEGAIIYSAAALSQVAFLPVAAGALVIGQDSVSEVKDVPLKKLFEVSLAVLEKAGRVKSRDPAGVITAEVNGAGVKVRLDKISEKKTRITVSARQYMLPRRETASGVLYQITAELK